MRTASFFANRDRLRRSLVTLAVAAAFAPATARAQQGGDAAKTGRDIQQFLDSRKNDQALKRVIPEITVEDADVRDVMDQIGRTVGRNIIVEPDIHEKVTISLRGIPWRDAVDVIAKMTKCEVEERGSILVLTQPPKVTIQFTDANVRTVLQLLAAYAGKNIIISPDVRGDVTLDLHGVHWLKALHAIVKTVGDYEVVEDAQDLLRVVPRSSIAQQLKTVSLLLRYLRPPTKYLATPPRTSVGTGQAATASANLFIGQPQAPTGKAEDFTLFRALKGVVDANKAQAPGSTIEYDTQKNAFLVRATQPLIDELSSIITRLDQEPAQLYVEVRFVSTADNNFLEHGIKPADPTLGLSMIGPFPSGQTVTSGTAGNYLMAGKQVNGKQTLQDGGLDTRNALFVNTNPVPIGTLPFTFGTGLGNFERAFQIPAVLDFRGLQMMMNLIDRDTRSRLLQSPSLFMLDNEDSVLFVGENVPFAQITSVPDINGNVTQSIAQAGGSPIAIGFSLFISPHVIPDSDRIMMTVIPRVSSPGGSTGTENIFESFSLAGTNLLLPHTKEQAMVTHIMIDDGQTAVIGGLLTEQDNEIITRVPILSSIPLLGNLFTHTHREKGVSNLVIMITGTIVRSKAQVAGIYRKTVDRMHANDFFYKKYEAPAAEAGKKDEDKGSEKQPPAGDPSTQPAEPGNMGGPGGADEKK